MTTILTTLQTITKTIYQSQSLTKKSYKNYAQQLIKLYTQYTSTIQNKWYKNIQLDVQNMEHQHDGNNGKNNLCQKVRQIMGKQGIGVGIGDGGQGMGIGDGGQEGGSVGEGGQEQPYLECKIRQLFAIGFYNIARISSRPKYLQMAIQLIAPPPQYKFQLQLLKVKWWLQMLALISSRQMYTHLISCRHCQAYYQACKLMEHIVMHIQKLDLGKEDQMLARETVQLVRRSKPMNMISANSLNQLQMSRKFETDCYYVSKSFHIADIMIIQPISPQQTLSLFLLYPQPQSKLPPIPTSPASILHHYVLYTLKLVSIPVNCMFHACNIEILLP